MFHALTAHPGLTQAQHRALPLVSNTDLSTLKAELLGQLRTPTRRPSASAPPSTRPCSSPTATPPPPACRPPSRLLTTLAAAVRRQRYCRDLLHRGTPELTHTAIHTATGVGVKLRPDLLVRSPAGRQLTLIDFKTTSCRDYAQFLTSIEQYDYDRQAALYLDALQATRFLILGVQKKAPHEVWLFDATAAPGFLEQGRKKYSALLRHHARQLRHQPTALPLAA